MRNRINGYVILLLLGVFMSCDHKDNEDIVPKASSTIVYQEVNVEYVLNDDLALLQDRDDEISSHVDSVLSGSIDVEFISTGQRHISLIPNNSFDLAFEIIDLKPFNPNSLPGSFESLAARVIPSTVQILDNSTVGYPDAVMLGKAISKYGKWSDDTGVLGNFSGIGNFQGEGDRFLGFRFSTEKDYKYGWVRIYCSDHNDTLRIVDYAYNSMLGSSIDAGQIK